MKALWTHACRFCARPMHRSDESYKANPFCTDCYSDRLRVAMAQSEAENGPFAGWVRNGDGWSTPIHLRGTGVNTINRVIGKRVQHNTSRETGVVDAIDMGLDGGVPTWSFLVQMDDGSFRSWDYRVVKTVKE